MVLLRRMKSAITSKYPRVKLVPDGTKIGPGQAAVTPTDIKAELIAEYGNAIYDGLAADMANFKSNLVVEIDNNDPNRVNVLWPPRLAGQLRQFDGARSVPAPVSAAAHQLTTKSPEPKPALMRGLLRSGSPASAEQIQWHPRTALAAYFRLRVDGQQYEARGSFQVTPGTVKRTGVAGQDFVHGYIEEPIVPSIKGDISIGNLLSFERWSRSRTARCRCSSRTVAPTC
jgi:hypothetical protein